MSELVQQLRRIPAQLWFVIRAFNTDELAEDGNEDQLVYLNEFRENLRINQEGQLILLIGEGRGILLENLLNQFNVFNPQKKSDFIQIILRNPPPLKKIATNDKSPQVLARSNKKFTFPNPDGVGGDEADLDRGVEAELGNAAFEAAVEGVLDQEGLVDSDLDTPGGFPRSNGSASPRSNAFGTPSWVDEAQRTPSAESSNNLSVEMRRFSRRILPSGGSGASAEARARSMFRIEQELGGGGGSTSPGSSGFASGNSELLSSEDSFHRADYRARGIGGGNGTGFDDLAKALDFSNSSSYDESSEGGNGVSSSFAEGGNPFGDDDSDGFDFDGSSTGG